MSPLLALDLSDASLLFAVTAIILLATSEIVSPYYGTTNLKIDRKKLKNAALAMSLLFLFTVSMRIATMVLGL